ncbi:MAG: DUF2334 domain-containing protein [Acidobacteriota bacterium]|nr:DUF2334 domain-containing protein [Acidobacteriota bacterium]
MNFDSACYLLRFDDFCPTMSWPRWQPFQRLLEHYRIRPILAVIPHNEDASLMVDEPINGYWAHLRRLEAHGATIALHGFRHVCTAQGKGLIPLHADTEFAGVTEEQQVEWLRSGLEILRSHSLHPRLFVAPRHGFDDATLRALHAVDLPYLSDGLSHEPVRRGGVTWIPQQLWEPVEQSSGLWTICMHSNTATAAQFSRLERFLKLHAARFTNFDEICAHAKPVAPTISDNLYASAFLTRFRSRRIMQQIRRAPFSGVS